MGAAFLGVGFLAAARGAALACLGAASALALAFGAFMAWAATSCMADDAMFWNCCVSEPHHCIGSTAAGPDAASALAWLLRMVLAVLVVLADAWALGGAEGSAAGAALAALWVAAGGVSGARAVQAGRT